MLPILLFELVWKTIWLIDYGLPQWRAGVHTTQFTEDFEAIALGVILIPIIPWGCVLPTLPEEAGGTLALSTVSIGASPRDARIAAALYRRDPSSQMGVPVHFSTSMNSHSIYSVNLPD